MSGNVMEWTHSLQKPYPYHVADGRENGALRGARVLRNGSFLSTSRLVRCALRYWLDPDLGDFSFRFRMIVSLVLPS